ncbi:ATP-dependent nuclease [Parahaliea mediterranea]|uniref:AAA family ATPase n=1 Tax=Parahaliea mediterranea TaxID=651086 RepID=A0A939DJ08_9GAMM|nr:AAA family ATPase [Parahaliea mediterranea]MBN7799204.1 AAA family ATPase [Parahaliea mediterranea]
MNILNKNGYDLKNVTKINVILGKNGCGKSTTLKRIEEALERDAEYGNTRYITPERGGALKFDASLAQNSTNEQWLNHQLRQNQFVQFKQQTLLQFRKLELLSLREIEKQPELRNDHSYTFQNIVDSVNSLLDNIEIRREGSDFKIYSLSSGSEIAPDNISSGESELISLGIECLVFAKECDTEKHNILFLDEPDAHLHPDLQSRLGHFLKDLVDTHEFKIITATHSTSFLGAFESYTDVSIDFVVSGQTEINFSPISDVYRKVLPVFGAHPLSNVFNEAPIMLVEGEDDERVWQQAIRTSQGRLRIFPCSVDSITHLNEYETEIASVINSIYDNAVAYSLRDRDDSTEEIDDTPPVVRMKLSCRAAENLLLTDEALSRLRVTWEELEKKIETWLQRNADHSHYQHLCAFRDEGFQRKSHNLKHIRNDLEWSTDL